MFKRTNFLYRLNSTAKVGWSSSITFATVGTALSTLVVVPGMSVLFSVLLGRDLSAPDRSRQCRLRPETAGVEGRGEACRRSAGAGATRAPGGAPSGAIVWWTTTADRYC